LRPLDVGTREKKHQSFSGKDKKKSGDKVPHGKKQTRSNRAVGKGKLFFRKEKLRKSLGMPKGNLSNGEAGEISGRKRKSSDWKGNLKKLRREGKN